MSGGWLEEFFIHSATVEPFLGTGGDGTDLFGNPTTIVCFVEPARKVRRKEGNEGVVGQGTLFCDPAYEPLFPPDSRITVGPIVYRAGQVNSSTLDASFPEQLAVALV